MCIFTDWASRFTAWGIKNPPLRTDAEAGWRSGGKMFFLFPRLFEQVAVAVLCVELHCAVGGGGFDGCHVVAIVERKQPVIPLGYRHFQVFKVQIDRLVVTGFVLDADIHAQAKQTRQLGLVGRNASHELFVAGILCLVRQCRYVVAQVLVKSLGQPVDEL